MKIAIPIRDGRLCVHFGHCEEFAIFEVDEATGTFDKPELGGAPPHEPGRLPSWLHERGVSIVIAGGMGRRAQQLFQQYGIQVLVGAPSDSPESLVSAFLKGELRSGENVCDH